MVEGFRTLVTVQLRVLVSAHARDSGDLRQLLAVDGEADQHAIGALADGQGRQPQLRSEQSCRAFAAAGLRGGHAVLPDASSRSSRWLNTWRLWNPRRLFRSEPRKIAMSMPALAHSPQEQ